MPHIALPEGIPGISGPLAAYPDTAVHLRGLAEVLLQTTIALSPAERELIAAYVSSGNACRFCTWSHAAVARQHWGKSHAIVDAVLADGAAAAIDDRLRALLVIADKVRQDGRLVDADDIAQARAAGANDRAIHDTVLIAAAFCMYNRYVDGLATWAPDDPPQYAAMGERLATDGYVRRER